MTIDISQFDDMEQLSNRIEDQPILFTYGNAFNLKEENIDLEFISYEEQNRFSLLISLRNGNRLCVENIKDTIKGALFDWETDFDDKFTFEMVKFLPTIFKVEREEWVVVVVVEVKET